MGVTKGKEIKLKARDKEVSFQLFPEGSDKGTVSYLKRKRILKSRCLMTEGIRKTFV